MMICADGGIRTQGLSRRVLAAGGRLSRRAGRSLQSARDLHLAQDVRENLLVLLYGKAIDILMVAFGMIAVGLLSEWRDGPPWVPILSAIGVALLCARAVVILRFDRSRVAGGAVDVDRWLAHFGLLAVASSVCWGAMTFVCLASSHDAVLHVLSLFCTVATAGAVAARNGSFPRLAITQLLVILVPTTIGCLLADDEAYAALTLLIPFQVFGLTAVVDDANRQFVELFQTQQRLSDLTYKDGLTDVHNRHYFDRHVGRQVPKPGRSEASLGAMMIDVDFFKAFNDHYGHPAGDRCLQQVAAVLRDQLRAGDDILCRYGGEEFVVLIDGADAPALTRIAQRLCGAVAAAALPHEGRTDGTDIVTVSIGLAVVVDRSSPQALIAAADGALYEAKRLGRNRACLAHRAP